MLSLFGASAKLSYIVALESNPVLGISLLRPLNEAAARGLVRYHDEQFTFKHDLIQDAAYKMFSDDERRRYHNLFGLCLLKHSSDTNGDDRDVLFTACDQINTAGPSVVAEEDMLTIVQCNIKAGRQAMEIADFELAASLFSHGMLFLPVNHWESQYSLSLELFNLAAKCAVATTNTSSLQNLSGEVARHAKCFDDKLEISFCVMSDLVSRSKISAALGHGLDTLKHLGEPMPVCLSHEISYTNTLIQGKTEEDFMNYMLMTDKTNLITVKYMAEIAILSIMARPELHQFITLRLVQLTCLHGT
jgi:predicted ATPase